MQLDIFYMIFLIEQHCSVAKQRQDANAYL